MAARAYIASFEESDGFTCDHLLHGSTRSEVERTARIEAIRRNATLIGVRPAADGVDTSPGTGPRRLGAAKLVALLVPAVILAAVILLIQSSGGV